MALLSDLVGICASHRLDSEATLSLFSRRLREAGRVSKAGRGRGAARMSFLDGARFLIACAATDHPERAADAERTFSGMVLAWGDRSPNPSRPEVIPAKEAPATLDIALSAVLAALADGSLDAWQLEMDKKRAAGGSLIHTPVIVSLDVFRSGVSAVLRAGPDSLHYMHEGGAAVVNAELGAPLLEMSESWMRETDRFRSGKNLHASFDSSLLRAVAVAIAGNPEVIAARPTTITVPGAAAPGQTEEDQ